MVQSTKVHIVALLFLATVLVVYFFPAIKAGALSTFDFNYAYSPFELIRPEEVGNPLLSDQAVFFEPLKYYTSKVFREGKIPFWNPYVGLGTPLLAAGQPAVLFPLNLLFVVLPFGAATIMLAIAKLLVAGVGMYLLVWVLLQNRLVSLFAGVAFAFSGFNIVWLGHPHTNVSIWLPWLLLFTWQFFKTKKRVYLIPYAFVVGIQFFGGHIETSLHILSLTGLLALVLVAIFKDWVSFLYFAVSSVLGFFLAAPQLFPFIEYLLSSLALVGRSAQGWKPYLLFSSLIPSVLPNFFGNPVWHTFWYQPQKHFNYNETVMGFPGTLSLFLAPLALLSKKWRRWGLGIVLLIAAILLGLLGVPPFFTFLSRVPPFSWTLNGRLLLLTSFLSIVLAAIALDRLVDLRMPDLYRLWGRGRDWMRAHNRVLFSGTVASLILLVTVLLLLFPEIRDIGSEIAKKFVPVFHKGPKQALSEFGFVFVTFATLVILKLKNSIGSKLFLVLIVVVALLDSYLYSWNYNPPFAGEPFATTPEIEYVQQNAGYDRALIFGKGVLASVYRIYDPHNADSLVYYPLHQFMDLAGAKNRLRELEVTFENKRFLDFLDVRYIAFKKDKEVNLPGLEKVFEGRSMDVYQNNDALARAFTVGGIIKVNSADEALKLLDFGDFDLKREVTVEGFDEGYIGELSQGSVSIKALEPERVSLDVRCPGACFVVMTDTNYPGWGAVVDGKGAQIYKTDVAFRGVYIPEGGEHAVEFTYTPYSFRVGVAICVAALLALFGLTLIKV